MFLFVIECRIILFLYLVTFNDVKHARNKFVPVIMSIIASMNGHFLTSLLTLIKQKNATTKDSFQKLEVIALHLTVPKH